MIIKHKYEEWFQFSREKISPLLQQRNGILHSLNQRSEDTPQNIADCMKSELKQIQNNIKNMKALSKSMWYYEFSFKIHYMNMNSQVDWECIDILKGREKDHHKKTNNINTKKEDGTMDVNGKTNMRVMHPHFQKYSTIINFRTLAYSSLSENDKQYGTLMTL